MTHSEPEHEAEDPTNLRTAAVKALQSAVRQNDPHEFDRLTRHALWLLQRARGYRTRSDSADRRPASFAGRKWGGENGGYWRARQVEGQIHWHALSAIFVEVTLSIRKSLLISAALAGLAITAVFQRAVGAPIALAESSLIVSSNDGLLKQVYYYQGRYYPYRYNSRYYAHRVYRHGRWHYY